MEASAHGASHPLFGANRLKIEMFWTCAKGTYQTLVPEAHQTCWALSVKTARMADDAGHEADVPYARLKGYVDDNPAHSSIKIVNRFTWVVSIAQAKSHSAVFLTSSASIIPPLLAANQGRTVDLISVGRPAIEPRQSHAVGVCAQWK